MGHTPVHKIFICTSCKLKGHTCRPGLELITHLRAALDAAGPALADDFAISGVACMAGCDTPCTVGYQASKRAAYLFGNIDPAQDIDELVAFAKTYQRFEDGWFSGKIYPEKLRNNTLARVPSMIMISDPNGVAPQ